MCPTPPRHTAWGQLIHCFLHQVLLSSLPPLQQESLQWSEGQWSWLAWLLDPKLFVSDPTHSNQDILLSTVSKNKPQEMSLNILIPCNPRPTAGGGRRWRFTCFYNLRNKGSEPEHTQFCPCLWGPLERESLRWRWKGTGHELTSDSYGKNNRKKGHPNLGFTFTFTSLHFLNLDFTV